MCKRLDLLRGHVKEIFPSTGRRRDFPAFQPSNSGSIRASRAHVCASSRSSFFRLSPISRTLRFHSPLCSKEHVELIPSGYANCRRRFNVLATWLIDLHSPTVLSMYVIAMYAPAVGTPHHGNWITASHRLENRCFPTPDGRWQASVVECCVSGQVARLRENREEAL